MGKRTEKLTTRQLERFSKELPEGAEVWDVELSGYHIRAGKRGLAMRVSYYNSVTGQRRVLTVGRYGKLTASQGREAAKEALAVIVQGGDPRAIQESAKEEALRQRNRTLRAYLDGPYAAHQERYKDGKATLQRIRTAFSAWLDRPMSSLTRVDVERWQAKQEALDEPRAHGTLQRTYAALLGLLSHATERNVIPTHPLRGIKLQRPALSDADPEELKAQRRYLEDHEVEAFFKGIEAYQEARRNQRRNSRAHGKSYLPDLDKVAYVDHVAPWLLTMYYTGLRPGDLFGLRWEHVNLNSRYIYKVIEKTARLRIQPTRFPLSTAAMMVLSDWNNQQGSPATGFVFPSPRNGKRMDKKSMQKPWAHVRSLGALPEGLHLYTLRHNFASQLVMKGIDLLTVSKLMGHATIQTTISFYAHLKPDHTLEAVEAFASSRSVTN